MFAYSYTNLSVYEISYFVQIAQIHENFMFIEIICRKSRPPKTCDIMKYHKFTQSTDL
jgi:hypothetical protein